MVEEGLEGSLAKITSAQAQLGRGSRGCYYCHYYYTLNPAIANIQF